MNSIYLYLNLFEYLLDYFIELFVSKYWPRNLNDISVYFSK